jgi:hypothetical protein
MAVATLFGTQMGLLTGNSGGAIQQLPGVNVVGARQRTFVETIALASQASGSVIGVARVPLYAVFLGITLITDTSLGSATVSFGDANQAALYGAATTLTAINTPTLIAKADAIGPILNGYDSVTGNLVDPFMPQFVGQGGALYEDIVMAIGSAAFPASGTLMVLTDYQID